MARLYFFVFVALFFLPGRGEGRKLLKLDETKIACRSFFYNTQVNNNQGWLTVPNECVKFVGEYMEGLQYPSDSQGVLDDAKSFFQTVSVAGNGKDIVVFDVDETCLSNLQYYRNHHYGGEIYNDTAFNIWVDQGTAPAIPATLKLYNFLKGIQFGLVLLTGRPESQRAITTQNLLAAGYSNWTELILKSPGESGTALQYKSRKRTELAAKGFQIYSSIGDQWSDILGPFVGNRTFKIPNPMYFIA